MRILIHYLWRKIQLLTWPSGYNPIVKRVAILIPRKRFEWFFKQYVCMYLRTRACFIINFKLILLNLWWVICCFFHDEIYTYSNLDVKSLILQPECSVLEPEEVLLEKIPFFFLFHYCREFLAKLFSIVVFLLINVVVLT